MSATETETTEAPGTAACWYCWAPIPVPTASRNEWDPKTRQNVAVPYVRDFYCGPACQHRDQSWKRWSETCGLTAKSLPPATRRTPPGLTPLPGCDKVCA